MGAQSTVDFIYGVSQSQHQRALQARIPECGAPASDGLGLGF